MNSTPLQIDELTPAVCRTYRAQLLHALKAMQMLLAPGDWPQSWRGRRAEDLISEYHGKGLDPYIPAYSLHHMKKACRATKDK